MLIDRVVQQHEVQGRDRPILDRTDALCCIRRLLDGSPQHTAQCLPSCLHSGKGFVTMGDHAMPVTGQRWTTARHLRTWCLQHRASPGIVGQGRRGGRLIDG